jgi:hypothetical protein
MSGKFINIFYVVIVSLFIACSSGNQQKLKGKWLLAGKIAGNSPTSYWFQKDGNVIAPWEERVRSLRSSGKYKFINETHIKIIMYEGPYKGITFFYEIAKLDREELILRGSIQDIKMKRAG